MAELSRGADPAISLVTNTAIGCRACNSQSNSLVLGSIAGINDATASTRVGIGVTAPQRLLHIAGPNAIFRMDRSANSAAFMIVRTDGSGNVLKNFVVGGDAFGGNIGKFIINDYARPWAVPGSRQMTIRNSSNVEYIGSVFVAKFIPTSAPRFKTNVRTLEDPLELVRQLRGVRVNWKDSGKSSVGLIAEEVAKVLPELVALEAEGEASGVNSSKLVAVLVEAIKAQGELIDRQTSEVDRLRVENSELHSQLHTEQFELGKRIQRIEESLRIR